MLLGFVLLIVIILVIVGIMSTGVTSSSGGVDQTKATKLITEMSTLAQASGFYKSLTKNNDYEGISVQKLEDNGIVSKDDIVIPTSSDTVVADNGTATADGNTPYLKSKAVPGMLFDVKTPGNNEYLEVNVLKITNAASNATTPIGVGPADNTSLAKAIEKAYEKFGEGSANSTNPKAGYVDLDNDGNGTQIDGLKAVIFR